jgi:cell division septation protein DedD
MAWRAMLREAVGAKNADNAIRSESVMNNHQRGVYQPLMDNIPIYDLSDEEIEEEERSRLPLLIVVALVVLAAFAGVVWLAYNQGVARGRASAAVVIAAPQGPVRTAPTDAGGEATPYTGLKVYGQPVPPDQEAQSSVLARTPPRSIVSDAALPGNAVVAPTTEAPPVRLSPDTPAIAAAPPAKPAIAAAKPAAQAPARSAPAPLAAVEPTSLPAARSAAAGGAVLQIGAYESQEIADGAWAAFKARHASVAGTLADDIQKADLGAKGTWYRLRMGPFADKAAAAAACEKLKAEGATCFVAAP